MPFISLLNNCRINGTSFNEKGVTISVRCGDSEEKVVFFNIDNNNSNDFRLNFSHASHLDICDLLVRYTKNQSSCVIWCLVEIGRKTLDKAIRQIEAVKNSIDKKYPRNSIKWVCFLCIHTATHFRPSEVEKERLNRLFGKKKVGWDYSSLVKCDDPCFGKFIRNAYDQLC